MDKKVCQADECGTVLSCYNDTDFCSIHQDKPCKKVYFGYSLGEKQRAVFSWWGEEGMEDCEHVVDFMITGKQYELIKKLDKFGKEKEFFGDPDAVFGLFCREIPEMILNAFKKLGKV